MAVVIRLSRVGKRNNAVYRLISQDKGRHPTKQYLEHLGNFYPLNQQQPGKPKFDYDKERVAYWVSQGAQCSPRVKKLIKMAETGKWTKAKKPRKRKKAAKAEQPAEVAAAQPQPTPPPTPTPEPKAPKNP